MKRTMPEAAFNVAVMSVKRQLHRIILNATENAADWELKCAIFVALLMEVKQFHFPPNEGPDEWYALEEAVDNALESLDVEIVLPQ